MCPCESGKSYQTCCQPYHLGTLAPTAELLMRSRYSAYVLKLEPYLLNTWHPDTRPESLNLAKEEIKWLGLQVKRYQKIGADSAIVEFVARYKYADNLSGKAERLHEISQFRRIDTCWYYLNGDHI